MRTKDNGGGLRVRPFGQTDLQVSEIGLGCSSIGGVLDRTGDEEAVQTLHEALDRGVNFYDTADVYSLGNSERLLGRAFKDRRDRVIIATKVGSRFKPLWKMALKSRPLLKPVRRALRPLKRYLNLLRHSQKQYDYSPGHVRQALEGSLGRLGTDYVDLLQLYNPSKAELERGDLCEMLDALKAEGKVRYYGISCRSAEDALICVRHLGISTVQIPISLVDFEAIEAAIPLALEEKGIAVIAREPLAQGLLTKTPKGTLAEQSARSRRDIQERKRRAEAFRFLERPNRSLAQAALQFGLQVPGVSTVIVGVTNRQQLDEALRVLAAPPLSPHELSRVRDLQGRQGPTTRELSPTAV